MNTKNVIALTKQPYDKITLWKTNKEQTNTMIQGYPYCYGTLKAPTCDGPYDTGPVPKFRTTQTWFQRSARHNLGFDADEPN